MIALSQVSGVSPNLRFLSVDAQSYNTFLQSAPAVLVADTCPNGQYRLIQTISSPDVTGPKYAYYNNLITTGDYVTNPFSAFFYDAAYIYMLAIEEAGKTVDPAVDLAGFQVAVNNAIRLVSNPSTGDVTVDPTDGWTVAKAAVAGGGGGVDYDGITGKVNIDTKGDAVSGYNINYVTKNSSGDLEFKLIVYIQ